MTLKKAITPSVCTSAIEYPRKPSSEPTDRSMFRDTMISTMPVAMMAIEVLCTERFHRFRAVRKSPPDKTLNAIQMTTTAAIIPNSRVSTSADAKLERHDDVAGTGVAVGAVAAGGGAPAEPPGTSVFASVMCSPPRRPIRFVHQTCPPSVYCGRGARWFRCSIRAQWMSISLRGTPPRNRLRHRRTAPRC